MFSLEHHGENRMFRRGWGVEREGCNFLLAVPMTLSFQERRVCLASCFPRSTLITQDTSPEQLSQSSLGYRHTESVRPTINKPAAISVIYWSPGILVSVNLQDSSYFWAVRQNQVSGGLLAGFELSLYHFLWHSLSLG